MSPPPDRQPVHAEPVPVPDAEREERQQPETPGALTGPSRSARRPPDVAFTTATGPGPEDGHVTFAHDSAALTPAARERLRSLVDSQLSGADDPVSVTVHGYATEEGDDIYNRNLSAHRAAAVRAALVELLPAGSQIRIVARGETDAFGPGPANRRAGVALAQRTTPPGADPAREPDAAGAVEVTGGAGDDTVADADAPAPSGDVDVELPRLDRLQLDPTLLRPPDPDDLSRLFPPGWWLRPRDPAADLLDYEAIYGPLHERNVPLAPSLTGGVEAHWQFWYLRLHRDLGLRPDWAAWIVNKGTASLVEREAAREHPTAADRFEREIDIQHQLEGGWQTPIVPLHPALRFDLTDLVTGGDR